MRNKKKTKQESWRQEKNEIYAKYKKKTQSRKKKLNKKVKNVQL